MYKIRTYCSKCHKLLQESEKIEYSVLKKNWDDVVPMMPFLNKGCSDCGTKTPNMHIELKLFNCQDMQEYGIDILHLDDTKERVNEVMDKIMNMTGEEFNNELGIKTDGTENEEAKDAIEGEEGVCAGDCD